MNWTDLAVGLQAKGITLHYNDEEDSDFVSFGLRMGCRGQWTQDVFVRNIDGLFTVSMGNDEQDESPCEPLLEKVREIQQILKKDHQRLGDVTYWLYVLYNDGEEAAVEKIIEDLKAIC